MYTVVPASRHLLALARFQLNTFQTDRPISPANAEKNLKFSAFGPWRLLYSAPSHYVIRDVFVFVYICLSEIWSNLA